MHVAASPVCNQHMFQHKNADMRSFHSNIIWSRVGPSCPLVSGIPPSACPVESNSQSDGSLQSGSLFRVRWSTVVNGVVF